MTYLKESLGTLKRIFLSKKKKKSGKVSANCHGIANFGKVGRENKILQGSASPVPMEQTNTLLPLALSLSPIVFFVRAEYFSEVSFIFF